MLLYKYNYHNSFNQKIYDRNIDHIDFSSIKCPKCHCCCSFSFYGTYDRSFILFIGIVLIHVQRVMCSSCRSTHAVLPSFTVPFLRISLPDACDILTSDDIDDILTRLQISMDTVRCIRERYSSTWNSMLPDFENLSFIEITLFSIKKFKKQFLQLHKIFIDILPT